VRDARLFCHSTVGEQAQVYGGTFRHSFVGGRTVVAGAPDVQNSIIRAASISGTPRITNCRIEEAVEVWDSPTLTGVALRGGVYVYGDARLSGGWECGGLARIHEGDWRRPPVSVDLGFAVVTECVDGKVLIDCSCRRRDLWLKHGAGIARREGWTTGQYRQAMALLEAWPLLVERACPS
jgi:hypothetical protein